MKKPTRAGRQESLTHHYFCVGKVRGLVGETALGQMIDGVFKVQVDHPSHAWSYSWWKTPINDWVRICP